MAGVSTEHAHLHLGPHAARAHGAEWGALLLEVSTAPRAQPRHAGLPTAPPWLCLCSEPTPKCLSQGDADSTPSGPSARQAHTGQGRGPIALHTRSPGSHTPRATPAPLGPSGPTQPRDSTAGFTVPHRFLSPPPPCRALWQLPLRDLWAQVFCVCGCREARRGPCWPSCCPCAPCPARGQDDRSPPREPVPSAGQPLGPGLPGAGWLSAAARPAASVSAAAVRARAAPRRSVL